MSFSMKREARHDMNMPQSLELSACRGTFARIHFQSELYNGVSLKMPNSKRGDIMQSIQDHPSSCFACRIGTINREIPAFLCSPLFLWWPRDDFTELHFFVVNISHYSRDSAFFIDSCLFPPLVYHAKNLHQGLVR